MEAEFLVIGGGLGAVATAPGVARAGQRVVPTERYGRPTSQAVAPDEHTRAEQSGVNASHRALRDGVRDYCRRHRAPPCGRS